MTEQTCNPKVYMLGRVEVRGQKSKYSLLFLTILSSLSSSWGSELMSLFLRSSKFDFCYTIYFDCELIR